MAAAGGESRTWTLRQRLQQQEDRSCRVAVTRPPSRLIRAAGFLLFPFSLPRSVLTLRLKYSSSHRLARTARDDSGEPCWSSPLEESGLELRAGAHRWRSQGWSSVLELTAGGVRAGAPCWSSQLEESVLGLVL
ncbi:unnamed protein product [Lampetra planeri]